MGGVRVCPQEASTRIYYISNGVLRVVGSRSDVAKFATGDVIRMEVVMEERKVRWYKNGALMGEGSGIKREWEGKCHLQTVATHSIPSPRKRDLPYRVYLLTCLLALTPAPFFVVVQRGCGPSSRWTPRATRSRCSRTRAP